MLQQVLPDSPWSSLSQWSKCLAVYFFEITSIGLYQNLSALFLFSNSYVAKVSESSRLKEPWMSLLSKSKCTQFLFSTSTLVSLLQPKMAAVQDKWQEKNVAASFWKSNGKYLLFQDEINITYIYFISSSFVWLSYQRKFKVLLVPERFLFVCLFVCFLLNKTIWCGNVNHLTAFMSYCWSYFFA